MIFLRGFKVAAHHHEWQTLKRLFFRWSFGIICVGLECKLTINAKTELMLKAKGVVEEKLTYLQQTSNKLNFLQTVVPNNYSFQELLVRCAK